MIKLKKNKTKQKNRELTKQIECTVTWKRHRKEQLLANTVCELGISISYVTQCMQLKWWKYKSKKTMKLFFPTNTKLATSCVCYYFWSFFVSSHISKEMKRKITNDQTVISFKNDNANSKINYYNTNLQHNRNVINKNLHKSRPKLKSRDLKQNENEIKKTDEIAQE